MTNLFTYQDFLNELKLVEYTELKNIESTFFVVFKENVYFFDFGSKNYVEKVKDFLKFLIDSGLKEFNVIEIDTFDDANDFFEKEFSQHPKIISGTFYLNYYNDKIPKDSIVARIFENTYFEIRISDVIKKLIKVLPGLEYLEINKEIYHKDDIIKKYGMEFNKRTKLPDVVYHGTSSEFIDGILKRGIQPKMDNTIFNVKHDKYIFLTTSFETAKRYSRMSVGRDFNLKTKQIVLEIKSDRLDKDKIIFDFDFYNKFVGKGNDVYDKIISDTSDTFVNKKDLMFANISNKNMGGLYKKFGYNGIILPTKINKIHIKTLWDKWYDFTVPEFKEYMKKEKMS